MLIIKTITKEEFNALINNELVFNTKHGVVDVNGNPTGYYVTRHKIFIEDRLADAARELVYGAANSLS